MIKILEYIEILKQLDSGGSATIYLGININTGKPVAVKELNEYLFKNNYTREKFREEANRYLYLEHPNIVELVDLILYPNRGYLIMEYIEGKNLRDYMKSITGWLPVQNVALFIHETLNALEYAHNRGIIHMDIKPSNIMLSNQNQIKLIDFGISQKKDRANDGIKMGTPFYMSPEQIEGKGIDERTDIYSLGITMYELIAGTPPFAGNTTKEELMEIIRTKNIPKVKTLNSYDKVYEDEINEIIKKSTAKIPSNRFRSCQEFKNALKTIIQ